MGRIDGSFYAWNERNVKNVPAQSGVYGLYESKSEETLIYVGSSLNIRWRFLHYWNTGFEEDPCKRSTMYYKRKLTTNHLTKEGELLEQYQREHNGRLPRCNERVP
jgi:excinuclease UvrABC nuclease subunit